MRLNQKGFSILQTLMVTGIVAVMATGLMALTGYMQDGVRSLSSKTTTSMLSSTVFDRLQYDPSSLRESGFDTKLNPELAACLTGAKFTSNGTTYGGGGLSKLGRHECVAYDFVANTRKFIGFSIVDRVTKSLISGTPSAPQGYDTSGKVCNSKSEGCAIELITEFSPVCPTLFGVAAATKTVSSETIASALCSRPEAILVRTTIKAKTIAGLTKEYKRIDRVPASLWNATSCAKGLRPIGINADGSVNCGERVFEFFGPLSNKVDGIEYTVGPGATSGAIGPSDLMIAEGYEAYTNVIGVEVPAAQSKLYFVHATRGWFDQTKGYTGTDQDRVSLVGASEGMRYQWSRFPLAEYQQRHGQNNLAAKTPLRTDAESMSLLVDPKIADPKVLQFAIEHRSTDPSLSGLTGYGDNLSALNTYMCPTVRADFKGSEKAALVRYNSNGDLLWTSVPFYDSVAKTSSDLPTFVETQNGTHLVGAVRLGDQDFQGAPRPTTHQYLALAKVNRATGALESWKYFGPESDVVNRREYFHAQSLHVESAPLGQFYLAGTVTGGRLTGSTTDGIFFVSLIDQNLNVKWTKQFGPTEAPCEPLGSSSVLSNVDRYGPGFVMTSSAGFQHGVGLKDTDLVVLTREGNPNTFVDTKLTLRRFDKDGNEVAINSTVVNEINTMASGRLMNHFSSVVTIGRAANRLFITADIVDDTNASKSTAEDTLPRGRALFEMTPATLALEKMTELHFIKESRLSRLRAGEPLNLVWDAANSRLLSLAVPTSRLSSGTIDVLSNLTNGFIMMTWPEPKAPPVGGPIISEAPSSPAE